MFCTLYVIVFVDPARRLVGVDVNARLLNCAVASVASAAVLKKW